MPPKRDRNQFSSDTHCQNCANVSSITHTASCCTCTVIEDSDGIPKLQCKVDGHRSFPTSTACPECFRDADKKRLKDKAEAASMKEQADSYAATREDAGMEAPLPYHLKDLRDPWL